MEERTDNWPLCEQKSPLLPAWGGAGGVQAGRALRPPSCHLATESPTSLSYAFFVSFGVQDCFRNEVGICGKGCKEPSPNVFLEGWTNGDQRSENDGICLVCPLKPTRMNVRCLEIRMTEVARHVFKKRSARFDSLITIEVGLCDTYKKDS